MPKENLSQILREIEALIERGETGTAARLLRKIPPKQVPRAELLAFAAVARRAGAHRSALIALRPLVYPDRVSRERAFSRELAIYSAILTRLGAFEEAVRLLERSDAIEAPETLLYRAFAFIVQWNYESAIPLLEKYLTHPLSSKERLTAELNLAAALVHGRHFEKALPLLDRLQAQTLREGLRVFHANTLELGAQAHLRLENWPQAARLLEEAGALLDGSPSLDRLFVRKWAAVLWMKQRSGPDRFEQLERVRHEAVQLRHWETIRSCDAILAVERRDASLVTHLCFGTPSEGFRQRLLNDYGMPLELPKAWPWAPGTDPRKRLDLSRPPQEIEGQGLGGTKYRLLRILAGDFYRPCPVARLHSLLHPEENYNPISSPARIYESVSELRASLRKKKIPLVIEQDRGAYRLSPESHVVLLLPRAWHPARIEDQRLRDLRERVGKEAFKMTDVVSILGCRHRRSQELVAKWIESGEMERVGAGRETIYYLKAA